MKRGKEDAEGTEPHPVKRREKYKELHSPADMPCCGNRRFWQSAVQAARIFGFIRRRDKAYASPQVSEYRGLAVLGKCCYYFRKTIWCFTKLVNGSSAKRNDVVNYHQTQRSWKH